MEGRGGEETERDLSSRHDAQIFLMKGKGGGRLDFILEVLIERV